MEIEPHEDDVFYDSLGMRLWEKRHLKVCTILESESIKRVYLFTIYYYSFLLFLIKPESYSLSPVVLSNLKRYATLVAMMLNL